MNRNLYLGAAAILALSSFGATGALAGKPKDIAAPLAISASGADDADKLADIWVDGRRQEMTGLAQVKDGEKAIRKGRKAERKASEKLVSVTAGSDAQRAAYIRLVSGFGRAVTPAEVGPEIKALKKAAGDWENAYERVVKAKANLKAAQLDIVTGQSAVRTGNELIASGREKMLRSETQSRPDYLVEPDPQIDLNDEAVELPDLD